MQLLRAAHLSPSCIPASTVLDAKGPAKYQWIGNLRNYD